MYGSTSCVAGTPGCDDSRNIDAPGMAGMEGGIAKRWFFFVDKEGIVRGKWIGDGSAPFSSDVLLKAASEAAGKAGDTDGGKPLGM